MKLLVGLGNPGTEYADTRHNVGFLVVDEIRRRHGEHREQTRSRSRVSRVRLGSVAVLLARPQTYMNHSGEAVSALMRQEEALPDDLIVICDDIYLDLGVIRLRERGTHGGHNGLRSIAAALGTTGFSRLRIGVGPVRPGVDHADFVLAPFPKGDRDAVRGIVSQAADCAEMAAGESVQSAMNRFNARQVTGGPGTDGAT